MKSEYQSHIDILRALAVLLVIGFVAQRFEMQSAPN